MRVGDVGYQKLKKREGHDYQHYQAIDLDTGKVVWVDSKAGLFTIDGVGPQASTETEKDNGGSPTRRGDRSGPQVSIPTETPTETAPESNGGSPRRRGEW